MKLDKDKVLYTALRLFAQEGYGSVSMQRIADEFGVVKSALYKHFSSKKMLFPLFCRKWKNKIAHKRKKYPAYTNGRANGIYAR